MPSTYLSPQQALTAVLQSKALAGFTWGVSSLNPPTPGNPYYDVADAPPPPLPFIEFDVAKSKVDHNFSSIGATATVYSAYVEWFTCTFRVLSLEAKADYYGSPFSAASLYYLLDGYANDPSVFDGALFTCGGFYRTSWDKHCDRSERDVSTNLIWNCEATYDFQVCMPYPPKPS